MVVCSCFAFTESGYFGVTDRTKIQQFMVVLFHLGYAAEQWSKAHHEAHQWMA